MNPLIGSVILLSITALFLAMIVAGFIRFRKPESGWLLIAGFIGLTVSVYFWVIEFYRSVYGSLTRSDTQLDLATGLMLKIGMFMPSIILLILYTVGKVHRAHKYSGEFRNIGCAGAFFALLIALITVPSMVDSHSRHKAKEAEVKSNIHAFQNVLERYGEDHEAVYPERIEMLIDEEYLTDFPRNPFVDQPMKNVPYGSPDLEGNFTYLPVTVDGSILGFYLIGYGYKDTPGQHLIDPNLDDHVIIILDASARPLLELIPDIRDVILQSQSED